MTRFKEGDRVLIVGTFVPGTHTKIPRGTRGTIEAIKDASGPTLYPYRVYSDFLQRAYWALENDVVEIKQKYEMIDPEFDLEDMELAEIIMEELK